MKRKLKALLCLTSIALITASTQSITTFASDSEGEYSICSVSHFALEGESEICRAVEYQDFGRLQRIVSANPDSVNTYNDRHLTPLHIAVVSGNFQMAKFLLDHDADANAEDDYDRTPLHFAVFNDDLDLVKILVEDGHADINARNTRGFTPYREAVLSGSIDIANFLLENGGTY